MRFSAIRIGLVVSLRCEKFRHQIAQQGGYGRTRTVPVIITGGFRECASVGPGQAAALGPSPRFLGRTIHSQHMGFAILAPSVSFWWAIIVRLTRANYISVSYVNLIIAVLPVSALNFSVFIPHRAVY